ncbi:MAG: glycosyltransferase family 39 protein [Anaerolineae bacterium]|nr:glycosyltransferase family 39 protein [Anaerolineae bacterium]
MKTGQLGWRLPVILIALVGLLVGYYWLHKPIAPQLMLNLLGALLDVVTVSALFAVGGGLGDALLRRLRLVEQIDLTPPERLSIAALLGVGLIALYALALGMIGLLNTTTIWGGLLVIAILTRRAFFSWIGSLIKALRGLRPQGNFARFLMWITLILLLLAFLIAIAPPFSWDSLVYHLVGPQRYLEAGRIIPHDDNFYLGMPKNGEMLFTVTMSLFGRDTSPALVHLVFTALALTLTGALARRYADENAGWLAATLVIAAYNVWELAGWSYVDLALMAYGAAVYVLLLRWHGSDDRRVLMLVGALIGLAVGVKYTAIFIAAGAGLLIFIRAPRRVIANGLAVGIPALLLFAPWMLRGQLLYQNPLFPMFGFGLNWDAARSAAFERAGWGDFSDGNAWKYLLLPVTATVLGRNLDEFVSFTHGPFLLTLPLLLPLVWRWLDDETRRAAWGMFIMIVPMWALWTYTGGTQGIGAQTRLAIATLPLAAAMGAIGYYGLTRAPRKPVNLVFIVQAALVMTTALSANEIASKAVERQAVPWLTGNVTADEYLTANLGIHMDAMNHLATLPAGTRVRLLWDLRTYRCPAHIECVPDILLDAWSRPLQSGLTPDEIMLLWQAQGDDYLLVYGDGYRYFTYIDTWFYDDNLTFPPALRNHLRMVWRDSTGYYRLYTWLGS